MPKQISYIEIVKKLDSGGSANLYLGIDLNTGNPVAVKELKDFLFKNSYTLELFRKEANRYLYLDHPNIVRLEDLILYPDKGYLVMEYIEGKNLRDYMKSVTGPMPFQNAALLISETLNALGYAHQHDVIHLDIKPSNIMLSVENKIKLIDFGISQTRNRANERVMGTPLYMSPEQIDGENIDERTDIYSLGVTIYELITGRLPFNTSGTSEELLRNIKKQEIKPIKALNRYDKELEDEMNAIIMQATAKDPEDRFPNCQAFKDALESIIHKNLSI
ncbi:MAG: serine/threonine protein kinase [Bacteroidetes bacterium]|nr:serine/threonine protein kinase [Bacteroidota bacterium]